MLNNLNIDKALTSLKRLVQLLESDLEMFKNNRMYEYIDNFEEKMNLIDELVKVEKVITDNPESLKNIEKPKLAELKELAQKFRRVRADNLRKIERMNEANKIFVNAVKDALVDNIKQKVSYNRAAKQVNKKLLEKELVAITLNNKA